MIVSLEEQPLKKVFLEYWIGLSPKKIIVVSSAPQIRYPDCYGIDMAKLEDFVAFKAALALHQGQQHIGSGRIDLSKMC